MKIVNLDRKLGIRMCAESLNVEGLSKYAKEALSQFSFVYESAPNCDLVAATIKVFVGILTEDDIKLLVTKNILECCGGEYRIN